MERKDSEVLFSQGEENSSERMASGSEQISQFVSEPSLGNDSSALSDREEKDEEYSEYYETDYDTDDSEEESSDLTGYSTLVKVERMVVMVLWVVHATAQCYFLFLAVTIPNSFPLSAAPISMSELVSYSLPSTGSAIGVPTVLVSLKQETTMESAHATKLQGATLSSVNACSFLQAITITASVTFLMEGLRVLLYLLMCPKRRYDQKVNIEIFLAATLRLILLLAMVWQIILICGVAVNVSVRDLTIYSPLVYALAIYFSMNGTVLLAAFVGSLCLCGLEGLVAWCFYPEEDRAQIWKNISYQMMLARHRRKQAAIPETYDESEEEGDESAARNIFIEHSTPGTAVM
eukprot:gb/GEZN01011988.1/.p1 GENE.gb/GEZN01011988.1/~~gb/GEZN01011988.1/.p1  ORF type:complete len:348 (-),score=38.87 gb/GEZN01011988.1/:1-1044(-)